MAEVSFLLNLEFVQTDFVFTTVKIIIDRLDYTGQHTFLFQESFNGLRVF